VSAREEILARIRSALAGAEPAPEVTRDYARTVSGDVVRLAAERIADYRATVTLTTAPALPNAIAARLVAHGVGRLAVPADLPSSWVADFTGDLVQDNGLSNAALDGCDGVLTASALAIAETGTIVLDAGPGQGRRALTLIPDYHLCVVAADRIVGTVPEAVELLDPKRPLTWISGPSATSDIELNRVEGVHGPRTLDVLIVE
jgi:L-lactate dehydrogenase complex protein LldG